MSASQPYPALDAECLQTIVRLVRNGQVRDEFKLFAKCVYSLVGAGLGLVVGEPDPSTRQFSVEDLPDEDLTAAQSALSDLAEDGVPQAAIADGDDPQKAMDPATVALLIQMAIKVIGAIIERRKNRS